MEIMMDKKLEEAILIANEFTKLTFIYGGKIAFTTEQIKKYQQAIEAVVQALENYQIKELFFLNNKLDNISATELQLILQPYYLQKKDLEQKDKIINELKNKLENSIPKQELKNILDKLNITDPEPWSTYKVDGDIIFDLKELLEGK